MVRSKDGRVYGKGRRKKTNSHESHGYYAAQRFLAEYGTRALDQRTRAAKELTAWKEGCLEDLGGIENVSTARLTLLEMAAFEWYLYRGLAVKVASARKDLPDVDVAQAGGWSSLEALKRAYQQPDNATMLRVVTHRTELREVQ